MAVILQTRCFQMDNCEPDLSFSKYVELDCFRWLYIYGHICDFLSRYAQLKQYILLQSEQPGDWHQMKTTGPQKQDDWNVWNTVNWYEYVQVVMTSQNVDLQELQILLKEGGGGGGRFTHFSDKYLKYFLWNSYQVNTTPHWSLVNNGSGNGLVPSSNKPLYEPMFTQISGAIWRH